MLEDAKQKRFLNSLVKFFLVTYDQKKAYDSVQRYSIRATLERFNAPENFILLIMNLHENLRASFKTFYGLTESFSVLNGLQQGNPLYQLCESVLLSVQKSEPKWALFFGYKLLDMRGNIKSLHVLKLPCGNKGFEVDLKQF